MSKIPYVVRRGDTLYFRIRVPASLHSVIQRREIVQTLQTQNRQQAIPIALDLASKAKTIFNKLSRDMEEKDLYEQLLNGLEGEQFDAIGEAIEEKKKEPKQTSLPLLLKEYKLKRKLSDSKDRELDTLIKAADERILHKKEIEDLRSKVKRLIVNERSEKDTYKEIALNITSQPAPESPPKEKFNTPTVSEVTQDYLSSNKLSNLKKRTKQKYATSLKMINIFMGNDKMSDIRQFHINKMFGEIERLPPDWKREENGKYKSMSIKQIIKQNTGDGLHMSAFDGYKSPLTQFIGWAKNNYNGSFQDVDVRDIKYEGVRRESEGGQRSFKLDELIKLFTCKEMKSHCKSSKDVGKFWLPVIGLYTGMRVNEICQINPFKDIIKDEETGILYFLVSEKTEAAPDIKKSVKSGNERRIPIHSRLIDLGIVKYTDSLKDAGFKRMFPFDSPHNETAGGNTARNFRRFIEEVGLKDETKSERIVGMHAFRKTIITKSYRDGFIAKMLPIVGHERRVKDENGVSLPKQTLVYVDKEAKSEPLIDLKETIEKVTFDIDFYKPVKPTFK